MEDVSQFEVRFYQEKTEAGYLPVWTLCESCAEDRREEGAIIEKMDDTVSELLGEECEDCYTVKNPAFTEQQMEAAVDRLCDLIDGNRTSIENGDFDDPSYGDYEVEISGWLENGLGRIGDIGGWVILDRENEQIIASLSIEIGEQFIEGGWYGKYDAESDDWKARGDAYDQRSF